MRKQYFYIGIALLVSLFIYLFYRTEKTVVNDIVIRLISFETFARIKEHVIKALPLNEVAVYSLPEGLWIFCITLTSRSYYLRLSDRRVDGVFIPLIFCLTLEIFQLFHITNGRFDLMDIGVSIVFWLLGCFALSSKHEKQNIFAQLNLRAVVCLSTYCVVYLAHVLK